MSTESVCSRVDSSPCLMTNMFFVKYAALTTCDSLCLVVVRWVAVGVSQGVSDLGFHRRTGWYHSQYVHKPTTSSKKDIRLFRSSSKHRKRRAVERSSGKSKYSRNSHRLASPLPVVFICSRANNIPNSITSSRHIRKRSRPTFENHTTVCLSSR